MNLLDAEPLLSMPEAQETLAQAPDVGISNAFHLPGESLFGAVAAGLVSRGWSIFPQQRDRRPGAVRGEVIKWSETHNLIHELPKPAALADWIRYCPGLNVALVFGPASGHAFAIDIDITDVEFSARTQILAFDTLGKTPFRRIGAYPKIALIYRHAPDDPVQSTSFKFADGEIDGDGLEVLSAGKLLTIHGVHHRTGDYFNWIAGEKSLLTATPKELPLVSSRQVAEFLARVEAIRPFRQGGHAGGRKGAVDWAAADTSNNLRVPHLIKPIDGGWTRDEEGLVDDGRERYLTDLTYQGVRGNREALLTAAEGGAEAVERFKASLAYAVHERFTETIRLGGRFNEARSRKEVGSRVAHLVAKFLSGGIYFAPVNTDGIEIPEVINPEELAPREMAPTRTGLLASLPPPTSVARNDIRGRIEPAEEDDAREIFIDRAPVARSVQAGLRSAFDAFFAEVYGETEVEQPRLHVMLAPTGAGKTSQCVRYIASDPRTYTPPNIAPTDEPPGPIVMLLPTYANIEELRGRARVLNLDGDLPDEDLVLAARNIGLLSEEQGIEMAAELRRDALSCRKISKRAGAGEDGLRVMTYMGKLRAGCRREEEVALAMAAEVGTAVLCQTVRKNKETDEIETLECPYYRECPAIAQRSEIASAHLVFMPHSFLSLKIPDEIGRVRAVIADERIHHLFLHTDYVSLNVLRGPRRPPRAKNAPKAAKGKGRKAPPPQNRWDDPHEMIQFRQEAVEIVLEALAEEKCPAARLFKWSDPAFRDTSGSDLVEAALLICAGGLQRSGEITPLSSLEDIRRFCEQPQGREIRQEKKLWEIIKERIALLRYDEINDQLLRAGLRQRLEGLTARGASDAEKAAARTEFHEMQPRMRRAKGDRDYRLQLLRPKNPDGTKAEEMVRISWRDTPNWPKAPVMLLDASAQGDIVRKIWNKRPQDFVLHNPVEDVGKALNVRIVGIIDRTYSTSSITATKEFVPEARILSARNLARVRSILSCVAGWAGEGRVVAGTSIALRELISNGWAYPGNVDWCHFGAMRGLDVFKFHRAALSIGRMEIPVHVIDGLVAALSYDDPIPEAPFDRLGTGLTADGKELRLPLVDKRIRLRNGKNAIIQVPGYPEEDGHRWAAIIQRQYREEELLQFVGRLRPVYREGDSPVWFALSSILPDTLIVDDLIRSDDLTSTTSTALWEGARLCEGVISAPLLHALVPHLFPRHEDAELAMRRAGIDPGSGELALPLQGQYWVVDWTDFEGVTHKAFIPGWYGPDAAAKFERCLRRKIGLEYPELAPHAETPKRSLARARAPDNVAERIGSLSQLARAERARLEEVAGNILDTPGQVKGVSRNRLMYPWRHKGGITPMALDDILAFEAIEDFWRLKQTTPSQGDIVQMPDLELQDPQYGAMDGIF